MTLDFDAYRAAYDRMTYAQHAAFYELVALEYPEQAQHSREHLDEFFWGLHGRLSVLELGGWRGEAAGHILAHYPNVRRWLNVEICRTAAENPAVQDIRYAAWSPKGWPWETPLRKTYGVGVLSHVIEHMKARHLARLIPWMADAGVEWLYVEAPLKHKPREWAGSQSTHVLELGWPEVLGLFAESGYQLGRWDTYDEEGRPRRHVLTLRRQASAAVAA